MKTILIDGKKYKVTENLGFQVGYLAKKVLVAGKEKTAVKVFGYWRFWTVEDRLHPPGLLRNKWVPNQ